MNFITVLPAKVNQKKINFMYKPSKEKEKKKLY